MNPNQNPGDPATQPGIDPSPRPGQEPNDAPEKQAPGQVPGKPGPDDTDPDPDPGRTPPEVPGNPGQPSEKPGQPGEPGRPGQPGDPACAGGGCAALSAADPGMRVGRVRLRRAVTSRRARQPAPAPAGGLRRAWRLARLYQSTWAPDCFTASPHFFTSPAMKVPVASGVCGIGSAPRSRKNFCMSGELSTWPICLLR